MSDFLNLEPYNYHFIYPDDYDYYTTINFHTKNSPLNEWDIVY